MPTDRLHADPGLASASRLDSAVIPEMFIETTSEPTPTPSTGTSAAFFDVDNTLMRGASLFQLGRKMYRKKAFSALQAVGFAWKQFKFILRGENIDEIHDVKESVLSLATGIPTDFVTSIGEELFDDMIATKIWPGTRALAEQHLNRGRRVWLVTATPVEVAEIIASRLNLTGALGTVAEVSDGVYTGRLVGDILHCQAKADAVKVLAEKEGLDLEQCWAYSDSANDIPLLSIVGHPVAINPDAKLRRYAHERNWPIYDFRAGRRAATLGLRMATAVGVVYGLWRSWSRYRQRGF